MTPYFWRKNFFVPKICDSDPHLNFVKIFNCGGHILVYTMFVIHWNSEVWSRAVRPAWGYGWPDSGHHGGGPGGDSLHLLASPAVGDTFPVRLWEVGHAPEDGAYGRTQAIQAASEHDGVLPHWFGAASAVPLPFYSEATPGFADAAWRGGTWESEGGLAARADKLWAVHAPSSSAVASVSSTEAVEANSGACAAVRGSGKGYRGRGGQQQ